MTMLAAALPSHTSRSVWAREAVDSLFSLRLFGLGEEVLELLAGGVEFLVIGAVYSFAISQDFLELLDCLGSISVLAVVAAGSQ